MRLPDLPHDKAMHCLYGVVLFAILNPLLGAQVALAGVIAAGVGKEAADWWNNRKQAKAGLMARHGVEWLDFVATAAGGGLGFVCAYF